MVTSPTATSGISVSAAASRSRSRRLSSSSSRVWVTPSQQRPVKRDSSQRDIASSGAAIACRSGQAMTTQSSSAWGPMSSIVQR